MKHARLFAPLLLSTFTLACKLDWKDDEGGDGDASVDSGRGDGDGDGGGDGGGNGDGDGGGHGDGGSDGDGGMTCLRDQDGDGYGVEGVRVACSGGDTVEPGDCDDDDELAYPGAPRVLCDAVDNDCDEVVEESAEEVCNFVDDDCDGLVDPNLAQKLDAAGQHVHVQSGADQPLGDAQVALLARPGGGWLLSLGHEVGVHQGLGITARKLDAQGLVDSSEAPLTILPGATRFVADSDGEWIVVLARTRAPVGAAEQDDSNALRMQLFKASDLSLVGDQVLVNHVDADTTRGERDDRDDCNDVEPMDVGVMQSGDGQVSMAAGYLRSAGTLAGGASTCGTTVNASLYFRTYSTSTGWDRAYDDVPDGLADNLILHRVPCRNEWVVTHSFSYLNPGWMLQVYGINGEPVRPAFSGIASGVQNITGLAHLPESCTDGQPTMVVAYVGSDTSYVQRWSVDADTGAMAPSSDPVSVSALGRPARLAHAGGRWFAAGHDVQVLAGSDTAPHFWEIAFDGTAAGVRELPLFAAVRPGDHNPNNKRIGVLALPEMVVAAYGAAPRNGNLNDHREQGATDHAVAATYRIGCQ
jgi:hypothetical protein